MLDIKKVIYPKLRDDSTLQGLTGYTASDPRIYFAWIPKSVIIDSSKPAYIVYYQSSGNKTSWDREEELYSFTLYSRSPDLNESIFNRMDALLHNQVLTGATDNHLVNLRRIMQFDTYEDDQLLYMKSITYDAVSVPHKNVDGAVADDGGSQTDQTTAANNDTTNDMTLLPSTPAVNDAYYLGSLEIQSRIYINISTAGSGTWTIVWEYWDGSAWTALSNVTDGTTGFTVSGINSINFTVPSNWATKTVASIASVYWIRGRVSVYTSVSVSPIGKRAFF